MLKFQHLFKSTILCLVAIICATLCATLDAQTRRRVAVLDPIGNPAVTEMNKRNVRGALTEIIVNTGAYIAVSRNHIDHILKEQGFQRSELFNSSRAKQLGELLGADLICVTEIMREKGEINIECSIIDVETGEITNSASEFLPNDSNVAIRTAVEGLVRRMFRDSERIARQMREQAERDERERAERERETREKAEREVRERTEREARERAERERETRERAEREKREKAEQAEREARKEKERAEREAAERKTPINNSVREAKATINRLMPHFTFEKKGKTATCVNKAMKDYLTQQQQLVLSNKQDYWHSLVIKIDNGKLIAHSMYVFKKAKDKLNHTNLSVSAGQNTISTTLTPKTSFSNIVGITTEDAEISNHEILQFIANNPNRQIQITIKSQSGTYKNYTLNPIIQTAIAQTLELFEAMSVMEQYGEEIYNQST